MSSKSKHSKKISKVAARTTAVPPSKGRRQDDPPNKANLDAARTAAKHDVMRTITGAKVRAASPPATTPTVVRSKSRTNVTDRTSVQQVVAPTATRIPLDKDRQDSKFIPSRPESRNEVFDHDGTVLAIFSDGEDDPGSIMCGGEDDSQQDDAPEGIAEQLSSLQMRSPPAADKGDPEPAVPASSMSKKSHPTGSSSNGGRRVAASAQHVTAPSTKKPAVPTSKTTVVDNVSPSRSSTGRSPGSMLNGHYY